MRSVNLISATLLSGLLLVSASVAATPHTVLVIPFENATARVDLDGLEEGMAELLTVCLSAYPEHLAVVDRSTLDALVHEQSLGWEEYVGSRSLASIGRIVRARYVLRGSFTENDGVLHVQALLFESDTTRLVHSAEARLPATKVASILCDTLGTSMAGFITSGDESAPRLVSAEQPEMQLHVIEGLGHYYNRNYAQAFPAFLSILREEPDHADAHYWLGKSFQQAGLDNLARTEFREFLRRFPQHDKASEVSELLAELNRQGQ